MKLCLGRTYPETIAAAFGHVRLDGGGKTCLVVPDRFSLEAEEALVRAAGGKTLFDVEVTTFARLADKLAGGAPMLTAEGCAIAVAAIMEEQKDKLVCFRGTHCAVEIYETIAQLAASGVRPEDLNGAAESALARKLDDLKLVYAAFERFLQEGGRRDASIKMLDAIAAVPRAEWVKETDFVFVGFDALPLLNRNFAVALGKHAHAATFCVVDEKHVFGDGVLAAQLKPLCDATERVRPALSPLKKAILKDLGTGVVHDVGKLIDRTGETLALFASNDPDAAAEHCAKSIRMRVREQGMRYRDIAVVTADPAPLLRTLDEYGIPYNSDAAINLALHPLARLMTDALACVASHCDTEAFARLCFNPLVNADTEAYALWDDYVRRFGLDHGAHLAPYTAGTTFDFGSPAKNKEVADARAAAETVRIRAARIVNALSLGKRPAADYADALAALDVPALADVAPIDDAYRSFDGVATERIKVVLDNLRVASRGMQTDAAGVRQLLVAGFGAADVRVAPTYLDAVSVFAPESFGFGSYRLLFHLGADDGVLPSVRRDCGLLGDGELEQLEKVGLRIDPRIAEVNARARLRLFATLFLAPEVELISATGAKTPNFLFRDLQAEFGLSVQTERDADLTRADTITPAVARSALFHAPDERVARRRFHTLYNACRAAGCDKVPPVASALREAARMTADPPAPPLDNAHKLFFGRGETSISQIEQYFACPYKHFLTYGLRCRLRKVAAARAADIGTVLHAVAEKFAPQMPQRIEDVDALARRIADDALAENEAFGSTAHNARLCEQVRTESVALCRRLHTFAHSMRFRFDGAEIAFGRNGTFPALGVGDVGLSGKIDRLDLADDGGKRFALIIDYKTGFVGYELSDVYFGRQIQLFAYMRVLTQCGMEPAATLFYPVRNEFDAKGTCGGWASLDGALLGMLDDRFAAGETSEFLPVYPSKKTGIAGAEHGFTRAEWDAWLTYTERLLAGAVAEIEDGFVTATPYQVGRTVACDRCDGRTSCPFVRTAHVRVQTQTVKKCVVCRAAGGGSADDADESAAVESGIAELPAGAVEQPVERPAGHAAEQPVERDAWSQNENTGVKK